MTVTRWEHRLELLQLTGKDHGEASRAEAVSTLDALGSEGWEVIGFSPSSAASHGFRVETNEYVVLLKRPAKGR